VTAQLDRLVEVLGQLHPVPAYGLLLLSAFVENVVPPVPGDAVVLLSAYLVGRGALDGAAVYAATCIGGTSGFMAMYWLGHTQGRRLIEGRGRRLFPPSAMARAEAWLARYGAWLVLANRFLSGVRSVIALSAGLGRMRWRPVLLFGAASMALWNGALLLAGIELGRNWDRVLANVERYNLAMMAVLGVAGVAWLVIRGLRRRP
jgi:membrane protein DedA with SNARE-associated domain